MHDNELEDQARAAKTSRTPTFHPTGRALPSGNLFARQPHPEQKLTWSQVRLAVSYGAQRSVSGTQCNG